ncbi:hypothetical protein [Lacticaseibacillus daqingensis]|uniref:hypothetical protein n=1 Tax=Lacticaseibacillus daqingensis TaxID=2486014 RepID=UPI000F7BAE0F|nr:hypothetical protein [Lacticaseibacillus daqingensis]
MQLKMMRGLLVAALGLTLGLAGCAPTAAEQSAGTTTSTSRAAAKTPQDYLDHVKEAGLTVNAATAIDVGTLPNGVTATSGVRFTSDSGVTLQLLVFKSNDLAQQARAIYATQGQRVYADRGLLLTAERGLAKDWFEKYRVRIFRQS